VAGAAHKCVHVANVNVWVFLEDRRSGLAGQRLLSLRYGRSESTRSPKALPPRMIGM
jgi:hypothetical protein